jgi:hypothetical protein
MLTQTSICQSVIIFSLALMNCAQLGAQGQLSPGAGNQAAIQLALRSPMVQSAYSLVLRRAQKIGDPQLRRETLDAIQNPKTCIQHRAGLTEADKVSILQALVRAGLADSTDQPGFPGGLMAGVFPPVLDEGSQCPHLPQSFSSAPGGEFTGHHSYPGGLAVHEANNGTAAINLADEYRDIYGHSRKGTATVNATRLRSSQGQPDQSDILIDQDIILAAPIWHDWAKTLVFQWNADGSEFPELPLGGNGSTDDNGKPGNSRTGAHHILGIAETMDRGLRPEFVIAQASAHSAPTLGNEYKVVNWLRTAAVIARIDPVEKGYLVADKHGRLRLPPVRKLGSLDLLNADPSQTNLLAEYTIHNLSDADYVFSVPSVATTEVILRQLAPDFGFDPADHARYNNGFRNPALTFFTGERLLMIYSSSGLEGVRGELRKMRLH